MDMHTPAAAHVCKISMLWNWYTIDTCFIASSWQVRSNGAFAGSCIGVFFLVVALQWLHRFCRELDQALARKRKGLNSKVSSLSTGSDEAKYYLPRNPYMHAVSHSWLFTTEPGSIIPSFSEQLLRSALYTTEWGVSYMIMLLFMYYNGYIIISCILGAFVGKLVFTLNEPLTCNDEEDRKCCK